MTASSHASQAGRLGFGVWFFVLLRLPIVILRSPRHFYRVCKVSLVFLMASWAAKRDRYSRALAWLDGILPVSATQPAFYFVFEKRAEWLKKLGQGTEAREALKKSRSLRRKLRRSPCRGPLCGF